MEYIYYGGMNLLMHTHNILVMSLGCLSMCLSSWLSGSRGGCGGSADLSGGTSNISFANATVVGDIVT